MKAGKKSSKTLLVLPVATDSPINFAAIVAE
jgi:hypothetical protein